jgi:uncharacterized protein YunC (DUF1805 family)
MNRSDVWIEQHGEHFIAAIGDEGVRLCAAAPKILAAMKRIEGIAHYNSNIAGIPDALKAAFVEITDEAGDVIALTKHGERGRWELVDE